MLFCFLPRQQFFHVDSMAVADPLPSSLLPVRRRNAPPLRVGVAIDGQDHAL